MPLTTTPYPLWHPMTDMAAYLGDPVTIVSGDGAVVVDEDGREYLAATSGLWNVALGFGRRELIDAVAAQLERLPYGTLFRFGNEPAQMLCRRLADILPGDLSRVFLSSSGAAAIDTALKLARRYQRLQGRPERRTVACLSLGYHGTSIGAMSVTGEDLEQEEYGVTRQDVVVLPSPERARGPQTGPSTEEQALAALEELFAGASDQLAALIFEPIHGSTGVVPLPREYTDRAQALCREHDVLLIADEVATGFGRTGRMFACELAGLEPDLLTMSKQINSGYLPLGATAVTEKVHAAFAEHNAVFAHGETQAGNPLACAAAIATLDVIEADGLVERAASVGAHLTAGLQRLLEHPHVADVRGPGLMIGIELVADPVRETPVDNATVSELLRQCQRRGLIVHPAPSGCSLFPPLVLSHAQADEIVDTLDAVLGRLRL